MNHIICCCFTAVKLTVYGGQVIGGYRAFFEWEK